MEATEWNRRLARAERLCSRREYCAHEIRTKLKAEGMIGEEADQVIESLIQRNFLNEPRYTRAFVHDKSNLQGWGPEKIRFALRAKQIPDTAIGEALALIDVDAQKEKLRRLLETKRQNLKADSQYALKAKLIRFGLSRGFSYDDIQSVLTTCQD